jgi:hypothetical protein
MHFKRKAVLGVLVILAALCAYRFSVHELKKMPFNYKVMSEQEGQDRILEALGGTLSEPFWIREVGLDHGTGHFPTGLPLSSPWWTQRRWW